MALNVNKNLLKLAFLLLWPDKSDTMKYFLKPFFLLLVLSLSGSIHAQERPGLELEDLMKFKQVEGPGISDGGDWVILTARPDRGDPGVWVCSTDGRITWTLPLGEKPLISANGLWVAATRAVPAEEALKQKDKKKGPKTGLLLLNTATGEVIEKDNISSFLFTCDSRWLISLKSDSTLVLQSLEGFEELSYESVTAYAPDSLATGLALVREDTLAENNGLFMIDLSGPSAQPLTLLADSGRWVSQLQWYEKESRLAFLTGIKENKKKSDASLMLWKRGMEKPDPLLTDADLEEGWKVYHSGKLWWSRDGERLFAGIKPLVEYPGEEEEADSTAGLYDRDAILVERGVDVWHWNDPLIKTMEKKRWETEKDRTYTGVYHMREGRFQPLADTLVREVRRDNNKLRLLGSSDLHHTRKITWDGRYRDYYLVDLANGKKKLFLENQQHEVSLSPDGHKVSWYRDGNWFLMDAAGGEILNLTGELEVGFRDEDWDYPEDDPGYGMAGWMDGSGGVLIYDKYDIWMFNTETGDGLCLTEGQGREQEYRFRIRLKADPEKEYFATGELLYLSAYHYTRKHTALFSMKAGRKGLNILAEEDAKFTLLAKARNADMLLWTRQSYTEFPDLRVSGPGLKKPVRLTDVNPQVADFAWGNASLVDWHSLDGTPLQGILITPEGPAPEGGYPVLVYYYRIFSNRLYDFNHVAVNHRPCFPYYAGKGYAIFLPDIKFDVGTPGYSATKCLVPGVQKLIAMGVANPDAICLHGHSWSGYQTAFAITQTDIFTCAIAGAPVSNMTSAYSGIRWESGMARQFQYEKSQSRIGGSLWEARDLYIENSPVFFADRIQTPLLIMFGDEDGAVPWYQGIELYLAMRRLDKDCIFLQYRGEGHHPKNYANKLDYTIRFGEYLDHYLKGEPAPEWIKKGIPYKGK